MPKTDVSRMTLAELKESLNRSKSARKTSTAMAIISGLALVALVVIEVRGAEREPQVHLWIIFVTMFIWSILKRASNAAKVEVYWSAIQRHMPKG